MTDVEKVIRWFENIANECDKLTSGNVAHLRAQIKGMAIRSAEYLTKHSQEPASEDLEQAAIDYDSCRPALYEEDDEGDLVECVEVRKDAFIAGAQWDREQIMKDDKFLIAIGDAYVDWIDGGINTNDEDSVDYIRKNMIYERQ